MNINEVIKYPILTEKTYAKMPEGVYSFAVDFRTNKSEVKKVIEHIFDVKVKKVNIQTIQKKPKKVGKFEGFTNRYKKVIVTLSEGTINIFPDEKEQVKSTSETKEDKDKKTDIEKRVAQKIAQKTSEKEQVKSTSETKEDKDKKTILEKKVEQKISKK